MNFKEYEAANQNESIGAAFDGNVTHLAIEAVVGPFETNDRLRTILKQWAEDLAGPGPLDNVDENKWRFVSIGPGESLPNPGFEVGKIYDRQKDIHARFGGQGQGGIATPVSAPFVFSVHRRVW